LVERVVMAEAGGTEPPEGLIAVAQCLLNACEKEEKRPNEIVVTYRYTKKRPEPSERVREAVSAVFDRGETVTEEAITLFYNPAACVSAFHESQTYVTAINNHRFFKETE